MNTVQLGKISIEFPEKLDELTASQLMDLAACYVGNDKTIEAQVRLAAKWGKKIFFANEKLITSTIDKLNRTTDKEGLTEYLNELHYNRMHLANLCNWITEEQVCKNWILPTITLKRFRFLRKTFAGPTQYFGNIEFWEWCRIEQFFNAYLKSGKLLDRNRFLACLYHPLKWGKRVPFTDGSWTKNMHWFNAISPVEEKAIIINYIAIKGWLALQHPHVFKRRVDDTEPVRETNMKELLLRAAKEQHLDEEIVAKKSLITELQKMEITGKDAAEAAKQNNS